MPAIKVLLEEGPASGCCRVWRGYACAFGAHVIRCPTHQPVIATGPYRIVRDPSYAGLVLTLAGIVAMFANWLSLATVILVSLVGFTYRIWVEEAALSATLGDAYRTYAAGRKRIIPFVC